MKNVGPEHKRCRHQCVCVDYPFSVFSNICEEVSYDFLWNGLPQPSENIATQCSRGGVNRTLRRGFPENFRRLTAGVWSAIRTASFVSQGYLAE